MLPGRTRRLPPGHLVVAAGLLLWAGYQNLAHLGVAQQLFDEPLYAEVGRDYVHLATRTIATSNSEHPPLAKLLFGVAQALLPVSDLHADRVVAGLATVLLGVVVGVWVGRAADRWTGLLAAGLVTLLPQTVNEADGRFSRFGMLEPVAAPLMVAGMAAGWLWLRSTGRRAWTAALAAGALTGLAASAKETAVLGLSGAVLLVLLTARSRQQVVVRSLQALAAAGSAAVVFLLTYVPIGSPLARLRYMFALQDTHALEGKPLALAGHLYASPPWWTELWYLGHGLGPALTAVVVLLAVLAVVLDRGPLVRWCLAGLAFPVLVHCVLIPLRLSFYWTLWAPLLLVLSALGLHALVVRVLPHGRVAAYAAAALLLLVPLTSAVRESSRISHLRPTGLVNLAQVQREHQLSGFVLLGGMYRYEERAYTGRSRLYSSVQPALVARTDTVVLSQPRCNTVVSAAVRALVAANESRLHRVYDDRRIVVLAADGPLVMPTPEQVSAQPALDIAELC